jgi:cytochrome c
MRFFWLIALLVGFASCQESQEKRVLVFSKTAGFRHESIGAGIQAIQKLGAENGFRVDTTENAARFTEDSLKKYSAVIFLNTTQDVLDYRQQADFERYIQSGGGFVGIHAAADTEYEWPWYNKLVGGYFQSHPNNPNVRKAVVEVINKDHGASEMLPDRWERTDEWYNYKQLNPDVTVLARLDKTSYEGSEHEGDHPIAWYQAFDGGRAFYTGGGHTAESFSEPLFLEHLLGGINYAIGDNNPLDYGKAVSKRVPEANRFVQTVLDEFLDEPMELVVMNDGKVLFIERRGDVKMYYPDQKKTKTIAHFDVSTTGNYEDGLLGVALDPNFDRNNWIYFCYSAPGDEAKQNVSRFRMLGDSIVMRTEKVIIEIPTQRETCCHSAGSIEFGPDGLMYISTGDNTSSKESSGYSPLDERPGRAPFDAQKSSGNTNDLRGKILRIRVHKDGSYSIPEGNLFPAGTPKTRPEIYVMGTRNPFRFSIDPKTNVLYWGDVGPDAGTDGVQGPRSYDEFNKTRKAGNFGWPYFQADNKPYPRFDFVTNTAGEMYDVRNPVNESPNNTGRRQLPLPQLPYMWYPYDESKEFPELGKGSRSAMSGPVYYSDMYGNSKAKFPDYYNGKLFIYEWARSWVKAVTFNKEGNFVKVEPFLPEIGISKPIDMAFGPDGSLYMLQYGANYFARNPDARLVRIDYTEGNRAPVAVIAADQNVGAAPHQVQFSSAESFDHDKDELQYEWRFTDQGGVQSTEPNPTFTFEQPGVYKPVLTVIDAQGEKTTAEMEIKVGNAPPQVAIDVNGNQSFYYDNGALAYHVKVSDKEDGSLTNGIDPSQVNVSFDYLKQGKDLAQISASSQAAEPVIKFARGKALIETSDCKSCHALDKKSIGPSYLDVAKRYKGDAKALDFLADKIIKGGNGNWGPNMMAAHPQHSKEETAEMARFILSLANDKATARTPLQGTYTTNQHAGEQGSYLITASYTDKGSQFTGPLTGRKMIVLRHPRVQAEDFDAHQNVGMKQPDGADMAFVGDIRDGSYIAFRNIDLSGISTLTYQVNAKENGGQIEVRVGSPTGKVISTAEVKPTGKDQFTSVSAPVSNPGGLNDLYFVFRNNTLKDRNLFNLDWIFFQKGSGSTAAR